MLQVTTSDHLEEHGHPSGWRRSLFATNHKDIGTLYIVFAIANFDADGVARARHPNFQSPCRDFRGRAARTCNGCGEESVQRLITAHGLIMIFFAVMPALIGGFGNWFVPIMIGAPDMAFPRMNNISFWLVVAAFALALISLDDAFAKKRPAGNNPWGPGATTLEWTLSSPPPFHQFDTLPVISGLGH
jgi:cytochrome c oxidase subunit 1